MAVLTADHFISDVERFRSVLRAAEEIAEAGYLVTLGIEPSAPSTGYGYIHQGELLDQVDDLDVFHVQRFTEKPSRETALHMVASGEYTWNSGMFIWRVDRIMEEFEAQMPEFYVKLAEVDAALGTRGYRPTLERVWPQVTKQAIDYGVMEGAEDVAVIPVGIGWSDVGSWASLAELLAEIVDQDEGGNVVVGQHTGLDTTESLIFGGERLIATIGLERMIVVDAGDALLVCPRDREQDVRDLVRHLEQEELDEYL
jgi:mannose-1-phosphate guanylyltransferase